MNLSCLRLVLEVGVGVCMLRSDARCQRCVQVCEHVTDEGYAGVCDSHHHMAAIHQLAIV